MTGNQVINKFYDAFQRKDAATMKSCYAHSVIFNDPAFVNLNYEEVRSMWEMLIRRGKDLELSYTVLWETDTAAAAEWTATYTFSTTGRKVVNHIKASFEINEGKIVRHDDVFDFYTWSSQALGWMGYLFGGTKFLQGKVQRSARASLMKYMLKK
jgi:ketosteroid isomerase-like protein